MSTVALPPMYGWDTVPWKKLRRSAFKLQKRIYQATLQGNRKLVRKLQRLVMSSRAAKFLAVRRVAQDNSGKRTAGIDGVKSLTKRQRLRMAQSLSLDGSAKPVRRVWIGKPDSDEKRPLGIPVMQNEPGILWSKRRSNPNGKRVSKPTVMVFVRADPAMMRPKQFSWRLRIKRNPRLMPTSPNVTTASTNEHF